MKITPNKILFVISVLFDVLFLYEYYNKDLFIWKLFLPVIVIPITGLKYYHFCVCFTYINRYNVNLALISNGLSIIWKLWFYFALWWNTSILTTMLWSIPGWIDGAITVYFIVTIYFMKSLLYFDINIPVDGWGISEKINAAGDAIPGL